MDLYALPLGGYDAVLGVQWLSSISNVLWDFQLTTLEFSKGNSQYKLTHCQSGLPLIQEMSLQQLDKEIYSSNLTLFLYSIENKKLEACDLNSKQLNELQVLLGSFESLYALPTQLPPSRSYNHHISLIQGAKPLNIRPCHYGPLQKLELNMM